MNLLLPRSSHSKLEHNVLEHPLDHFDSVHTMPAHFENGERCDGSKIWTSVHTMPNDLKTVGNWAAKNSFQVFNAQECNYGLFECSHDTRCRFQNVTVIFCCLVVCLFSFCFEWACQDFELLKANLGSLCMPHPGMGPLV